jgi:MAP/microtubule affinity-regulating kinase
MPSEKSRGSRSKGEDTNPDYNLPGIGNYIFQKTVGEGNFAKVKLSKHKLTGMEVSLSSHSNLGGYQGY